MEEGKKRLAVLVGCNYPNSPNELQGCINDVLAMRDVLVKRFRFDVSDIELLADAPHGGDSSGSAMMPTGANIKRALARMVERAEAGDVLYFHYSGHGTRIPSTKRGHPFRQEEAIVPCDFNLITDLDFRQLVNRLPKGASLTILSDSCHSGGLIDKEKEQIGPSSPIHTLINADHLNLTPRTLPFSSVLHHLSSLTNIASSDIATHLLELFASDASLRFRLPLLDLDLFFQPLSPDDGILLSGCQADETSADMTPPAAGGKAFGAFSDAVQTVLMENPAPMSNREVVVRARKILEVKGFRQHPCLYCSDENADAIFLSQQPQTSGL